MYQLYGKKKGTSSRRLELVSAGLRLLREVLTPWTLEQLMIPGSAIWESFPSGKPKILFWHRGWPVFISRVFLGHGLTHLLTYCPWPLLCYSGDRDSVVRKVKKCLLPDLQEKVSWPRLGASSLHLYLPGRNPKIRCIALELCKTNIALMTL